MKAIHAVREIDPGIDPQASQPDGKDACGLRREILA